jgi:hypothetical protein
MEGGYLGVWLHFLRDGDRNESIQERFRSEGFEVE